MTPPKVPCLGQLLLALMAILWPHGPLPGQSSGASLAPSPAPPSAKPMSLRATGTFQVKIAPLGSTQDEKAEGAKMGRMSLDKQFEGDLVGTAKGEMLTIGTSVKGSAVYVAVETIQGTLGGRKGTFALHHTGIMTRGQGELSVQVVPDSGTGELVGLTGKFTIQIEGGKHLYTLEYALP